MTGRRAKGASEDERALFEQAMKDAAPLKSRARIVHAPPLKVAIRPPHLPAQPVYTERAAPAIGGHAEAHLRRGRLEPEARLDLHGMTQESAYRSAIRFLQRCHGDGMRLVLIITGKGGVLRAQLPLWLGQRELEGLVAGLSEAHAKHGGSGAFYVHLRSGRSARQ